MVVNQQATKKGIDMFPSSISLSKCLVISAGLALAALSTTPSAEAGNLAWFAKEAYSAKPRNPGVMPIVYRGGGGEVTVWRGPDKPGYVQSCIVAWRGSTGPALVSKDWRANEWSQFGFSKKIPGANKKFRGGRGFVQRLAVYQARLKQELAKCKYHYITGHSLGGAMATIHWSTITTADLETYNAARPGNSALTSAAKKADGRGYCRTGDPVPRFPIGLSPFCTEPLAKSVGGPLANHKMDAWPTPQNNFIPIEGPAVARRAANKGQSPHLKARKTLHKKQGKNNARKNGKKTG